MKGRMCLSVFFVMALLGGLLPAASNAQSVGPQAASVGTGFTYQGRLKNAGGPVTGVCDFRFSLWDSLANATGQIGATQTVTNVALSEGAFTVELDFGAGAFSGDARWLEIAVGCPAGSGTYTPLTPRQPLTASPYALSLRPGAFVHSKAVGVAIAALNLQNDAGAGLYVESATNDGVYVKQAGSISSLHINSSKDGFDIAGAEGDGLAVGNAGQSGVRVYSAGQFGLQVESAGLDGVYVNSADDNGVSVYRAGSPSTTTPDPYEFHNGFEVAGAEGFGLWVGRADKDGVAVNSAGIHGVWVGSAQNDGVNVVSADDVGVYANTAKATQEWGFYTPDKIYAGSSIASSGPLLLAAQSGDAAGLEPGDVVSVSGAGVVLGEGDSPTPLVRRAAPGAAVMGVVYSRLVVETEVTQVERDGRMEQQTTLNTHSAPGAAAPGDFLLVVVLGPARVKVAPAPDAGLRPGDLLAVSQPGQAARLTAETTSLAPGAVVGQAMGARTAAEGAGLVWTLVMPR